MKPTVSFERYLKIRLWLLGGIGTLLCVLVSFLADWDGLTSFSLFLLVLSLIGGVCWQLYRKTLDVVDRIGLQLDALRNEEYNTWHLASYRGGRVASLRADTQRLTQKMQQEREAILQQESVLLALIEQLAIPVVVIDAHKRVYSANYGYTQLIGMDDLAGRFASECGLLHDGDKWHIAASSPLAANYRLYENHVIRNRRKLDIVMCFSVAQSLRDNEKLVWQRLLRVLNHEVRNSLTPISSIAQSLQQMTEFKDEKGHELLQVIDKRAQHLLSFVDAYSAFNRIQKPNKQAISIDSLRTSIAALNPRVRIAINDDTPIFTDEGQLQQVLINLVNNACDADSGGQAILVEFDIDEQFHLINVIDSGEGISNTDNLFVPFYSTKAQGNGIGLVLSRELIRQQGGELTLQNRDGAPGAIAQIRLPRMR